MWPELFLGEVEDILENEVVVDREEGQSEKELFLKWKPKRYIMRKLDDLS